MRFELLESRRVLATYFVGTDVDSLPGSCVADNPDPALNINCSIRAAIDAALNNPGPDTISIPDGTYVLNSALSIIDSDRLSFVGNSVAPSAVVLSGLGSDRIFTIQAGSPEGTDGVFGTADDTVVSIDGLTINNGSDSIDPSGGGGIRSNVNLVINNSIVQNNQTLSSGPSSSGGGVRSTGPLTIRNTQFASNRSQTDGGALFFDPSQANFALSIEDSTFSSNIASTRGGAFFVNSLINTSVSVLRSAFNDNSVDDSGGAIYIQGANLTFIESSLTNNRAISSPAVGDGFGGGLFFRATNASQTFSITDTNFIDNSSNTSGGGAAFLDADGTITGSLFESNSAVGNANPTPDIGGGFASIAETRIPTITTTDVIVRDNDAVAGGGIGVIGTNLGFVGTSIANAGVVANRASSVSAGIAAFGSGIGASTLTVRRTSINNNIAFLEGGGIGTSGVNLDVFGANISNNEAQDGRGGGIAAFFESSLPVAAPSVRIEQTSIESNTSSSGGTGVSNGGGVFIGSNSLGSILTVDVDIVDSTIRSNTASGNGGGIFSPGPLDISGSTIDLNSAREGGGIFHGSGSGNAGSLSVVSTSITNNTARRGGGVSTESPEISGLMARFTNATIENNRSGGSGGGVFANSSMAVIFQGGTVSRNNAGEIIGGLGEPDGGGLNIAGPLTVNGTVFSRNTATEHGGAIMYTGDTLSVIDAQFVLNNSGEAGGAIEVATNGDTSGTILRSLFESNATLGEGGAIYIAGDPDNEVALVINRSTLRNNRALTGGGVHTLDASVAIDQSTFSSNMATRAEISGVVFLDANGNGLRDPGEPGVGEGNIVFIDENGNNVRDAFEPWDSTDANGVYALSPSQLGDQTIRVFPPSNFDVTTQNPVTVPLTRDLTGTANFGIRELIGDVSGVVWEDRNANGIREINELGRTGEYIYADLNRNRLADSDEPYAISTSDGTYSLKFPGTGVYLLTTRDQGNLTFPQSGSHTVPFSGSPIDGSFNFGFFDFNITDSSASSPERGGGIFVESGVITVQNTTLSGNIARSTGGGIRVSSGIVTVSHTTVTENVGDEGGISIFGSLDTVSIGNSIFAANTSRPTSADVGGNFQSLGGNLIGDVGEATGFDMPNDIVGTTNQPINPLLGPLQFQSPSDLTQTHALLPGSPAIDRGIILATPLLVDQRGTTRDPNGDGVVDSPDIGSFEIPPNLSVGNRVWLDTNNNGLLDSGEQGINGAVIQLFQSSEFYASTTSDSNGFYRFDSLPAGNYFMVISEDQFSDPQSALFNLTTSTGNDPTPDPDTAPQDNDDNGFFVAGVGVRTFEFSLSQGTEPTNDGDADPNTNLAIDFAFVRTEIRGQVTCVVHDSSPSTPSGSSVGVAGQRVFVDLDGDRIVDRNEPSAFTDSSGNYVIPVPGGISGTVEVVMTIPSSCVTITPAPDIDIIPIIPVSDPLRALLPRSLAAAQVNADGINDIIIADELSGDLVVLATGSQNSYSQTRVPVGGRPYSVVSWNSGGTLESSVIAVADPGAVANGGRILVGPITNLRSVSVPGGPSKVLLHDFDVGTSGSDAVPEVVFVDFRTSSVNMIAGGSTSIVVLSSDPTNQVIDLIAGDFNGDGFEDLGVLSGAYSVQDRASLKLLLGDGAQNFVETQSIQLPLGSIRIKSGDILPESGHAKDEIVVLNRGGSLFSVSFDDGQLRIADQTFIDPGATSLVIGNFNGDSLPDVAVAGLASTSSSNSHFPDGKLQFFVGGSPAGKFIPFMNSGANRFPSDSSGVRDFKPTDMIAADLDGDGIDELAITNIVTNEVDTIKLNVATVETDVVIGGAASADFEFATPDPELFRPDVNRDNAVTAIDALVVINALNRMSSAEGEAVLMNYDTDVNRDGTTSPIDALVIINLLNRSSGLLSGEGEGESPEFTPAYESLESQEEENRRRSSLAASAIDQAMLAGFDSFDQ